jgi:hypothetical protein
MASDDLSPLTISVLTWAGPIIQQGFALATLLEGLAILRTKTAPASGLGFTSTFSNCLTWCLYGVLCENPSQWLANVAGLGVGALTTLIFAAHTEQSMALPFTVMAVLAAAVVALAFGDILPHEEAKQMTANIGIVQCVVMMSSGCAVWPKVISEGDSSSLSVGMSAAGALQGAAWAAFGVLAVRPADPNIWGPNLMGMGASLVSLLFATIYPRGEGEGYAGDSSSPVSKRTRSRSGNKRAD